MTSRIKKSPEGHTQSLLRTAFEYFQYAEKILILLAAAVTLAINIRLGPVMESVRAANNRIDTVDEVLADIAVSLRAMEAKLNQACERLARIEGKLE